MRSTTQTYALRAFLAAALVGGPACDGRGVGLEGPMKRGAFPPDGSRGDVVGLDPDDFGDGADPDADVEDGGDRREDASSDGGAREGGLDAAGEADAGEPDAGDTDAGEPDAGEVDVGDTDAGEVDAGEVDAGEVDAGEVDAGEVDAGEVDAGEVDAGEVDAGEVDAGEVDAGEVDAGEPDAGEVDAGEPDAGEVDAGEPDAGCADPGCGCVVLEDFEGGAWPAAPWSSSGLPDGGGAGTVVAPAAHDGGYGLRNAGVWYYETDVLVGPGDRLQLWMRTPFFGYIDGRVYLGFAASGGGAFSVVAAPNVGALLVQDNAGWGFVDVASTATSYATATWYLLEAELGLDGKIHGTLYESDGVTPRATVVHDLGGVPVGGVALRSFSTDVDTLVVCE